MTTLFFDLSQPTLLTWLVQATALLVAALAVTALLRRASAGARHLVWLGTLAAVLALPALSLWTPVRFAILPIKIRETDPAVTPQVATMAPRVGELRDVPARSIPSGITREVPDVRGPSAVAAVAKPPFPAGATIILVWGAITAALFGWLAFGALSVRRIVRRARPLGDSPWTMSLCDIADRLDLATVPRLVASDRVEMPFACGIFEPTIVLPAAALEWTADRRRAVLFHELAHVKRRDLVGHTLGRLACALYWFHPLVWTASRRLRAESERACDDLVLSCGARASDYADHLLDIVVGARRHGAPATALPMARRRELEGRVLAILDPGVRRGAPGRAQATGLVATLGLLALSVAAMAPAPRALDQVTTAAAPNGARDIQTTASRRDTSEAAVRERVAAPSSGASTTLASPPVGDTNTRTVLGEIRKVAQQTVSSLSEQTVKRTAVALVEAQSTDSHTSKTPEAARADSERVKLLTRVLRTDTDASVRRTAAWGLSEVIDIAAATEALIDALRRDDDDSVREMSAWALAGSNREAAQRALVDALRRDASDEVRETAAWALANGRADEYHDAFEAALVDASPQVRETAAWALGQIGRRPAPRALVAALGDGEPEVRETAAWALAEIQDSETGQAVVDAFIKERNSNVRLAELRALSFLGVQSRTVLDAALAATDPELRARAVRLLAGAGVGAWPEPRPRPRPRPSP